MAQVAVSGGILPLSYLWDNGASNDTVTGLAPGSHAVTVTDGNGCTAIDSITVAAGVQVVVTTLGNVAFCAGAGGDTLGLNVLGGTAPYQFQWWCNVAVGPCGLDSTADDDPVANPGVSGWYYVQATEGGGCASNVDSVWVNVLQRPVVDAGADHALCQNDDSCEVLTPVVTGAPGPYAYAWTPQAGLDDASAPAPCVQPDSTTTYALVVTAANGCSSDPTDSSASATVTVLDTAQVDFGSVPGPQVQLFLPDAFVEFSNQTQDSATFHWDFGDGLGAGGLNAVHSYGQPGAYYVTLTATTAQGCLSRITQGPFVVLPSDLFIPNVFSPNGDGINDVFLVNYVGGMPFSLQITDRWGVTIYTANNPAMGWNGQNGQGIDLPEGVYYYGITIVGMGRHTGPVTLVR